MAIEPEYEIGLTLALMKPLPWYGIPWPMNHKYVPYVLRRKTGAATYKGYGFPVASWIWSVLGEGQMLNLLSLFPNETDASVSLFIQTYKGYTYASRFATFTAELVRPVDDDGRVIVPRSVASGYSGIVARFEHLVEQ